MDPTDIGSERQLFVDDFWLGETHGDVERRLHAPIRRDIAIAAERPWEVGGVSYMVTFPDGGKYRAWYRCDCETADDHRPLIAYAESDDGVRKAVGAISMREAGVQLRQAATARMGC